MSTGRLKRKLGDLGVDPASQRANESFCLIGTPLPPLEKSKDNGEFVPVWKQDVRDEQGRRRLHGAFTGGFSAGYYNSVGSKEGWTPQTFVSSRANKAKAKTARPEDFMDAEDLAELREGQSLMDTTEELDLGQRSIVPDAEEDSIANALQASMAPPPSDSVGARILKKMGWKIGQGIGPRLTWTQRKAQDARLDPVNQQRAPEDDIEASKHTYAPRDTPLLLVDRKDNSHGLGYTPGMGLNATLGVKPGTSASGPNLSSGFGLGAMNDAEDDDIDVYDRGATNQRTHMAYDASDRDEDDRISIGGGRKSNQRPTAAPSTSATQTFHGGRLVLPDFMLSEQAVAEDRWFPLPDIPKGWKPDPTRVWNKGKENSQPPPSHPGRNTISADERGNILGETPLPSAPRSVFDYMSQKDRERLQNFMPGAGVPSASPLLSASQPMYHATPPPPTIQIPHTEAQVAQAALRGFKPFASDPVKQSRYNAYLHSQTSFDSGNAPPAQLPNQKVDEYNKELADYAKAALLFKPISGAMAGRFTSASIVDSGPKAIEGLYTPTAADARERERLEEERAAEDKEKEDDSPKANAARMGLFGHLTREKKVWKPVRLLCKRFGVKDPHPEPDVEDMPPPPPPVPESEVPMESGLGGGIPTGADASFAPKPRGKGEKRDVMNVGLGEDEEQGRETLTYERPEMDIFKAIFASDDEDSDGEDVEMAAPSTQRVILPSPAVVVPQPPAPISTLPTVGIEVDGGIFKPTFIPRDGKAKKSDDKKKKKVKSKPIMSFADDEEDGAGYTPERPKDKERPKKKKRRDKGTEGDEGDDGIWVEKVVDVNMDQPPDSAAGRNRKTASDFM